MTKYYNKEIPTEINVVYGGRRAGKTYYEFNKLKKRIEVLEEENKKLNNDIKLLLKENGNKEKVIKKQKEILNKAIEYIETEYNTYPSAEEWRNALKKILKGE